MKASNEKIKRAFDKFKEARVAVDSILNAKKLNQHQRNLIEASKQSIDQAQHNIAELNRQLSEKASKQGK
jgi:hypothetical protein